MGEHEYTLGDLNRNVPLGRKLVAIHNALIRHLPQVDRIAVAIYDDKTDVLKTFIHSSGDADPLSHYQVRLRDVPSLMQIKASGLPRVIGDYRQFIASPAHEHTQRIRAQGYRSSYTLPMHVSGVFAGFVFFNSYRENAFDVQALYMLDLFAHLVALVISGELLDIRTLLSAVKAAKDISYHRDVETGAHLERMSRYARLIAKELSPQHGFDDEYVEHIFLFAPLHDIGKISIPDAILHKPAPLTADEFEIMKTHTVQGRQIIDEILRDFSLDGLAHIDMLRNIAAYHHEHIDGRGYPYGLTGDAIPIEARIIAVADVFDALTSKRPYKKAWSTDDAYLALESAAGGHLDAECVQAMAKRRDEVEQIRAQFRETILD